MLRLRVAAAVLVLCLGCGGGKAGPADGGGDPDADLADADLGSDAALPDGGLTLVIPERPIVILMIGDGMGPGHIEGASHYAHGAAGQLFFQGLPAHGKLRTGNLSGTVDSAAAATTMSSGHLTYNAALGVDRNLEPVEVMVELAHRNGLSAGVVSTASLYDATPAGFSAHAEERFDVVEIAANQALVVQPDVMLGGGSSAYAGIDTEMAAAGYQFVSTAAGLTAADPANGKLAGFFSTGHMTRVLDRSPTTTQPTLAQMSLEAIRFLDTDPQGFFLMIEGASIDKAAHENTLDDTLAETVAFDDAVAAVIGWAADKPGVTVIVTADHDCGGLRIVSGNGAGNLPTATWRWRNHTNTLVDVYAFGNGAPAFADAVRDHRWVHEVAASQLEKRAFVPPAPVLVADGHFADLPLAPASQLVESGFGPGKNQLDGLRLGLDGDALGIGVEGLFEWGKNTVVLLIDVDLGAGTGLASPAGITDATGTLDALLGALPVTEPAVAGFGADFIIASRGGDDPKAEDIEPNQGPFPYPYVGGMRGLTGLGSTSTLYHIGVATNFFDGTRVVQGTTAVPVAGAGFEVHVPWAKLYGGPPPVGATLGIAVILVNDDGTFVSNQALPGFAAGTLNPGTTAVALPGVVRLVVDTQTATVLP